MIFSVTIFAQKTMVIFFLSNNSCPSDTLAHQAGFSSNSQVFNVDSPFLPCCLYENIIAFVHFIPCLALLWDLCSCSVSRLGHPHLNTTLRTLRHLVPLNSHRNSSSYIRNSSSYETSPNSQTKRRTPYIINIR